MEFTDDNLSEIKVTDVTVVVIQIQVNHRNGKKFWQERLWRLQGRTFKERGPWLPCPEVGSIIPSPGDCLLRLGLH